MGREVDSRCMEIVMLKPLQTLKQRKSSERTEKHVGSIGQNCMRTLNGYSNEFPCVEKRFRNICKSSQQKSWREMSDYAKKDGLTLQKLT